MSTLHSPTSSIPRLSSALLTFTLLLSGALVASAGAADKPRARDLGVPFDGTPGQYNAITDVKGVQVGQRYGTMMSARLSSWSRPTRR